MLRKHGESAAQELVGHAQPIISTAKPEQLPRLEFSRDPISIL
jgi:hypothetical protein